jgi:hypothetical protein
MVQFSLLPYFLSGLHVRIIFLKMWNMVVFGVCSANADVGWISK